MKSGLTGRLAIIITVALCNCNNNSAEKSSAEDVLKDSIRITSYAFKTADGWGYSITLDNKVYIKQDIIPVIQGIKSFATENDALKVASLVVTKIKLHQKPTLQKEELLSLGVAE